MDCTCHCEILFFKISKRKNGKGMISENEGNEKIKVTKVLEFVPERRPEGRGCKDWRDNPLLYKFKLTCIERT